RCREGVKQHAGERHQDDPAEQSGVHHLSEASCPASSVARLRNEARMIARPTAASAAATVMTKNTITWPSIEWMARGIATTAKLAALSISSIDMNMTITLRRNATPAAPIAKRTPARAR